MQYSSLPEHFVLADSVDLHESRFSVAYRLGLHRLLKHPHMGCTVLKELIEFRIMMKDCTVFIVAWSSFYNL